MRSENKRKLTDTLVNFERVCVRAQSECCRVLLCDREAWGAVCHPGPLSCRLLAYPRILLGASHTWVAHSSWTLHIQIAVMNIIRVEHRGDIQGTHTHSQSYVSAQTRMSAWTQMYARNILCIQNMTIFFAVQMKHMTTLPSHKDTPFDSHHFPFWTPGHGNMQ